MQTLAIQNDGMDGKGVRSGRVNEKRERRRGPEGGARWWRRQQRERAMNGYGDGLATTEQTKFILGTGRVSRILRRTRF